MAEMSRAASSIAANEAGWHYVLGAFRTSVGVASMAQAAAVAAIATEASGGSTHLRALLSAGRVELTVQPPPGHVTPEDAELARAITAALAAAGYAPDSGTGRATQLLEIAIDALDIPKVLPFWRAVLGYVIDPDYDKALVDPLREGPAVWFQQMDAPREQRNRIHFDITVPHQIAEERIAAALAAGGVLVSDANARAFWILADAEGNEICVCTWQDRD